MRICVALSVERNFFFQYSCDAHEFDVVIFLLGIVLSYHIEYAIPQKILLLLS